MPASSNERSDDAYRVFRQTLESGHPPDDWDRLLAEAQKESQRMQESLTRAAAAQ
ncbi:type II toxin-antitoxin system YhaV family toxin [Methylococcus sp. ANG]|uniref:type II toxin-antitoxin system YhaV family toxin n=1 Tax=unclassified Methylococcus TaxID=2618889 RepID=UPI001C52F74C|nr:type II toxin-antitoxin system YhaV family toxin [Methylococcus sp. Mc7]QXP83482.1 type II toxin-antitoxin system YhaV family toxin [Methylococcus sp. Mc7]